MGLRVSCVLHSEGPTEHAGCYDVFRCLLRGVSAHTPIVLRRHCATSGDARPF